MNFIQPSKNNKKNNSHITLTYPVSGNGRENEKIMLFIFYDNLIQKTEISTHIHKENGTKMLTAMLFEIANIHKIEMSVSKEMDTESYNEQLPI